MLFTLIEVAGLVPVIGAALTSKEACARRPVAVEPAVMVAALLFFVYLGFEEVANLARRSAIRAATFRWHRPSAWPSQQRSTSRCRSRSPCWLRLPNSANEAPLAAAVQKAWPGAENLLERDCTFCDREHCLDYAHRDVAMSVIKTVFAVAKSAIALSRFSAPGQAF